MKKWLAVVLAMVLMLTLAPVENVLAEASEENAAGDVIVTVTSCVDGAANSSLATLTGGGKYAVNQEVTVNAPDVEGYEFLGWSTSSSSYSSVEYPARGTWSYDGNVTLYAKWQQAKYTLIVDPDGGNYYGSEVMTVTYGQRVSLGSMSRTGYTFDGWYYDDVELGYSSFTYNYEGDIVAKAKWIPKTYNVRLNANGGSCSISSYTFTYDMPYSLPTPTRSGYIFDGWYDSSGSYGDYYPSSGLWSETSSPYTLYAHWIKA